MTTHTLKTFFKGMVTADDFVDGKFTILENDANTQAVVRDINTTGGLGKFKFPDLNLNLATLTGSALVDKGEKITLTANPVAYIRDAGKVYDAASGGVEVKAAVPLWPINDTHGTLAEHITSDGKHLFQIRANSGSGKIPYNASNGSAYYDLRHWKRDTDGVFKLVAVHDADAIKALMGQTGYSIASPYLRKDPATGKIYLFRIPNTSWVAEFDIDTESWVVKSWLSEGRPAVNGHPTQITVYDGSMFMPTGLKAFAVIDLNTGLRDDYEITTWQAQNYVYSHHTGYGTDGMFVVKDPDSVDGFMLGAWSLYVDNYGYPGFAMYVNVVTPSGASFTLGDDKTIGYDGLNLNNAPNQYWYQRPYYSPEPGVLVYGDSSTGTIAAIRLDNTGKVTETLWEYSVKELWSRYDDVFFCLPYSYSAIEAGFEAIELLVSGIEIKEE